MRTARKIHRCDTCNRKINAGQEYESSRIINKYDGEVYFYTKKECQNCIADRPKRLFKEANRQLRTAKRISNCPDAKFKYVWQGGWDADGGCPDGGDVRLECSECNLFCVR